MAQTNPEFKKTEGLYGTSIFDHIYDGIRNPSIRVIDKFYKGGLVITALGGIALSVDAPPLINPTPELVNERVMAISNFKDRFWKEVGVTLAGVALMGASMALEERREHQQNSALRRRIAASLSPAPETSS